MRVEKYSYRKSEDFYVIKDNGDSVTVLERYNLMVGNKVEAKSDFSDIESEAELTSSDKDYVLQSNLTKFEVADEGISKSTNLYVFIAFANKNEDEKATNCTGDYCYLGYWANSDESLKDSYKNENQTSYPVNVYDENSLLWAPVQNYKDYFISTLKKSSTDMRLITYGELIDLGCSADTRKCTKDFVYQNLNYWTSAARDYDIVWRVDARGGFDAAAFWYGVAFGVRPVITISKSDI